MRVDLREDAPLVTVVVPAYNPGAYLLSSLASLRSQSDRRWRAIVVDDGSDDDLSWVAEYDPRVILLRQENAGVAAARNAGLRQADSEFVAFLDQDDIWYPQKLAVQIDAMLARPAAGLSSTDFEIIDRFGERISGGYAGFCESYAALLRGNGIAASTVMIRRDLLNQVGPLNETYRQADDWDMWLRIARRYPVFRIRKSLVGYRLHSGNTSRNYAQTLREGLEILGKHELEAKRDGRAQDALLARDGKKRLRKLVGTQAFDAFRVERRVKHLLSAVRLAPAYTGLTLVRHVGRAATTTPRQR